MSKRLSPIPFLASFLVVFLFLTIFVYIRFFQTYEELKDLKSEWNKRELKDLNSKTPYDRYFLRDNPLRLCYVNDVAEEICEDTPPQFKD